MVPIILPQIHIRAQLHRNGSLNLKKGVFPDISQCQESLYQVRMHSFAENIFVLKDLFIFSPFFYAV